jgi:hypothetical protein
MNYRIIVLLSIVVSIHVRGFEFHLAPFSVPIDAITEAVNSSNSSSNNTYVYTPPVFTSGYGYHDSCTGGSIACQRPQSIAGNAMIASFGTAIFSVGSFFTGLGFYVLLQALLLKNKYLRYPNEMMFVRLQDACFGTTLGCFGLIFTILGATEIKESIKRIYQIYAGLPFDEEKHSA